MLLERKKLPRTQQQFDDSYALKVFCFQFVNYYSTLFYIAFFKDPFTGTPGMFSLATVRGCDCVHQIKHHFQIITTTLKLVRGALDGKDVLKAVAVMNLPSN